MIAIHKFPLRLVGQQDVPMPVDSNIISVQLQNGVPTIWAEVSAEDDTPVSLQRFLIVGTGDCSLGLYKEREHLATLQMQDGLVWHIYQIFPQH